MMQAKAMRWPNKCGWDVGKAEVRDLVTRYRVFVPTTPDPRPEFAGIERFKCCDVKTGTDPLEAVRMCKENGDYCFEGMSKCIIPFVGER